MPGGNARKGSRKESKEKKARTAVQTEVLKHRRASRSRRTPGTLGSAKNKGNGMSRTEAASKYVAENACATTFQSQKKKGKNKAATGDAATGDAATGDAATGDAATGAASP